MILNLTVAYDDGRQVRVDAGQREMARWEVYEHGCSALDAMSLRPVLYMRYLAWATLRRAQITGDSFEKWSATVESVTFTDDEQPDGRPDPTRADRPAGG